MIGRAAVAVLTAAAIFQTPLLAQEEDDGDRPQVEIVKTLGCVEKRDGDPASYWLTRAVEPEVSTRGVFNVTQIEEARSEALGSLEFHLVGVADFLDADSLLAWGRRSEFTSAEQANATGELQADRTVLVKGLLIEAEPAPRINLLAVVALADDCS